MWFCRHVLYLTFLVRIELTLGLASPPPSEASRTLFDRFRLVCPAESSCIQQFDPKLVDDSDKDEDSIWVAVYRSSNNKPSVLIKDEFLQAMRSATDKRNMEASTPDEALEGPFVTTTQTSSTGVQQDQQNAPVAVARLIPSAGQSGTHILDSMRCILKKEETDRACDGGSEHTEAIATAIDALLENFLSSCERFDGAIRTKATLVSAKILEDRGFQPVEKLERDMATHVSSLEACLSSYAARSVSADEAKSPAAIQRALKIVSLLGRLEQDNADPPSDHAEEGDDYDPWAGVKQFL